MWCQDLCVTWEKWLFVEFDILLYFNISLKLSFFINQTLQKCSEVHYKPWQARYFK